MTALIAAIVLSVFALAAVSVKRVPDGQVYSLYRHGKPVRLLQPGMHMVLPLLERVAHRIDLGGRTLRFEEPRTSAHELRGTVYWQVLEPERADAVIEQADQMIRRGVLDALQTQAVAAPAADRRELGAQLKRSLNGTLRERGVMVTRVELEAA